VLLHLARDGHANQRPIDFGKFLPAPTLHAAAGPLRETQ
jgi:hypothetical protein